MAVCSPLVDLWLMSSSIGFLDPSFPYLHHATVTKASCRVWMCVCSVRWRVCVRCLDDDGDDDVRRRNFNQTHVRIFLILFEKKKRKIRIHSFIRSVVYVGRSDGQTKTPTNIFILDLFIQKIRI